jgi:hypothetical protein
MSMGTLFRSSLIACVFGGGVLLATFAALTLLNSGSPLAQVNGAFIKCTGSSGCMTTGFTDQVIRVRFKQAGLFTLVRPCS